MHRDRVLRGRHLIAGAVAIIALPALSWLDGSGQLAWTMFARTAQYRLQIVATDRAGHQQPVGPSQLAAAAGSSPAAAHLSGAESWRTHNIARVVLRRHLLEVGQLACRVSGARSVDLTLWERDNLSAGAFSTQKHVSCDL
jgi:hypothetical protein